MKKLKKWLPPEIIRIIRHVTGYGSCFRGEFKTWEEAASLTQGYDADQILEKVLANTIKVRDGKAAFERDGVLFYERDDRFPMLAAVMRCATENGGNLRVLDFGGGLGSAYFEHLHWFKALPSVKWCVVEQKNFVDAGNKNLADGKLSFEYSIDEAFAKEKYDIVIFSGVLQYVKDFSLFVKQVTEHKPQFILIDRTPTIEGKNDIICAQKNGACGLPKSSYPARLFCKKTLVASVGNEYKLVSEFDAIDPAMGGIKKRVDFKGFLFERVE
jgi:putative methyltransferase (TIGR04325 family)